MYRRIVPALLLGLFCWAADAAEPTRRIRAGIIGLDTSHVVAFTKEINDPRAEGPLADVRITAAFPGGSPDIPSSIDRVPGYTAELKKMGVEIVPSIEDLLTKVDAVLLESLDGRPHLAQALPVLKARKPLFIDKPMAASLADVLTIFDTARALNTPVFSASSLRFSSGFQAARNGKFGKVKKCVAWSPMSLEPHHPDLFWYGVHGVETLYTIMGPGCETVARVGPEEVLGHWKDGREGRFLAKKDYGAEVEGTESKGSAGRYEGYKPLCVEICKFFTTGKPPVSPEETIELFAFMEAADVSKAQGGKPVSIADVLEAAKKKAAQRKP